MFTARGITGKKEQGEDDPIPRLDPNLRGACSLLAGSLVRVRGKFFWRRSPHPASCIPFSSRDGGSSAKKNVSQTRTSEPPRKLTSSTASKCRHPGFVSLQTLMPEQIWHECFFNPWQALLFSRVLQASTLWTWSTKHARRGNMFFLRLLTSPVSRAPRPRSC